MESATIVDTAVEVNRLQLYIDHFKQNNVAYLVGLFVSHQLGILDSVLVWGSGVCF
jgi:hypothetical protein